MMVQAWERDRHCERDPLKYLNKGRSHWACRGSAWGKGTNVVTGSHMQRHVE